MATAIDLRSDVLSIVRRSSTIFFSTSVVAHLLLTVSSFLVLFSDALILLLTIGWAASLLKPYDPLTFFTLFFLHGCAVYGYFIIANSLHFTALLTVLSSLLNRPPPTFESYMATIRNHGLFVFHKTLVLGLLIHSTTVSIAYVLFSAGGETRYGLPRFPTLDNMIRQYVYPLPLSAACCVLFSMVSVVVFDLAPCAQLFLGPADEEGMGAWDAVKQGCLLTFVMWVQATALKIVEDLTSDIVNRAGAMASIMSEAGDWRGFFVVLVVKAVEKIFSTVVWLVFYVAARCKAATEIGEEAFEMRDLNNCLDRLR